MCLSHRRMRFVLSHGHPSHGAPCLLARPERKFTQTYVHAGQAGEGRDDEVNRIDSKSPLPPASRLRAKKLWQRQGLATASTATSAYLPIENNTSQCGLKRLIPLLNGDKAREHFEK